MTIWPFNFRRRKAMQDTAATGPLSEKSQNAQPSRASSTKRKRRASRQLAGDEEKAERIEDRDGASTRPTTGKENVEGGFRRKESAGDDVTALPIKWELEHSPHLRPADAERPAIPYHFLNSPASQTSLPPPPTADGGTSTRTATLRSKRSTVDASALARRKSSKKRPNEKVREEEIRAMSAAVPIPKAIAALQGTATSKRDSYKRRTFDSKNEVSTLNPPVDTDVTAPEDADQHTWDIEHFWYNPRPAVRLSSVPAYPADGMPDAALPLSTEASEKIKGKSTTMRERRHKTIGEEAAVLDSSDIRAVLERDAKRREIRNRDRQERLDRKLRALEKSKRSSGKGIEAGGGGERSGRSRSKGKRRRDADIEKAIEAGMPLTALQQHQQQPDRLSRPPSSSLHPALRDEPMLSPDEHIGLGIEQRSEQNPFDDPITGPVATEGNRPKRHETHPATGEATPYATLFEDPVIETAREVRMSTAITPPLSPVEGRRRSSLMALDALPPRSPPPPLASPTSPVVAKRTESKNRRAGAWASFLKRSGTGREAQQPAPPPPAATSFSNTSRESMGKQPLPLHIVTSREAPIASGLTRTRSKFREDLPDAPISPPDSRVQSPELPVDAAAIAAAAAAATGTTSYAALSNDTEDTQGGAMEPISARSDTPVSPIRGHDAVTAASLASVDSEGSWLASGGSLKRASAQSGLSRTLGSLTRRNPDYSASFEDLGEHAADKDAEYIRSGAEAQRATKVQSALLEEDDDSTPVEVRDGDGDADEGAMTVHDSVQRVPTVVKRLSVVRSREGLLSEFTAEDRAATDTAIRDGSSEEDDDAGTELANARSVDVYTSRHARQVSAGSVQLLDVGPRRMSSTLSNLVTTPITTTSAVDAVAAEKPTTSPLIEQK